MHLRILEPKPRTSPARRYAMALAVASIGCGSDGPGGGAAETTTTTTTEVPATTGGLPTTGGWSTTGDLPTTGDSDGAGYTGTTTAATVSSTGASTDTGEELSSTGETSTGGTSTGDPMVCLDPVVVPGGQSNFGGVASEEPSDFAVGPDGSRYNCGLFFGPSTDLAPGGGASFPTKGLDGNMWFHKLSADGSYVYGHTWPQTEPDYFSFVGGIQPTLDGGVIVVGSYVGELDLDPGVGVDVHPAAAGTPYGASNAFMIKFDAAGAYQWGRSWGGTVATAHEVTSDQDGALYVIGYFEGETDLDPGPGVAAFTAKVSMDSEENTADGYLTKFDKDGGFLWARAWGGDLVSQVEPYHVALDSGGNVVVAGRIAGVVDLDPGPGMQPYDAALHSSFAMRFTADSAWDWSFGIGESVDFSGLAIGENDRIWLVGGYYGPTLDLDPGPGDTGYSTVAFNYAGFFARYSPAGAYELSGVVSGPGEDQMQSIVADCDGDQLYIVGSFGATVDLDPGDGVAMHSSGGGVDPFVLAIDGDGAYRWSRSWPGAGFAYGYRIAVDADHMVHAQICYLGNIDADAGPGMTVVQSAGERDILLEKLNPASGDW